MVILACMFSLFMRGVRGEVHPAQVTHHRAKQTHTGQTPRHAHTLVSKGNLERPINLTITFLDCGRKSENPHIHRESMQTTCRKTPHENNLRGNHFKMSHKETIYITNSLKTPKLNHELAL
ncbi:hypothetical protein XENOCAPTIV_016078 [Xenoophorus captivus]|uniref:Secreted protein n=1 Tax=Xenoophorus captivus TaxID=1517983 RepID=A0ABV0S7A4_9TELE